jgi:dsDNA-binding SOS-regulon protein
MALDLQGLHLSAREVEQISGLEMSDHWVGGMLGGVYRFSQVQHPMAWFGWIFFEALAGVMLFVFTMPIGLGMAKVLPTFGETRVMLASMGVSTLVGMVVWHGYRLRKGRSLQTFMHLLDEIDQYHKVLQAVAVLDRLATVRGPTLQIPERLETLQITRDCLVTGLKTERIMREQGSFFAQLQDGFAHLDQSLALLKASEMQAQADEYATILQQSLLIGERVQQELYGLLPEGRSPSLRQISKTSKIQ